MWIFHTNKFTTMCLDSCNTTTVSMRAIAVTSRSARFWLLGNTRVTEPASPGPATKLHRQNKTTMSESFADRTMPATELVGSPNAEP